MGYDLDMCKLCLQAFNSDLNRAVNFFLENKNLIQEKEQLKSKLESLINMDLKKIDTNVKSEKALKASVLLNKIAKDIPEDDEAYLDLNMDEDAIYINKYYSLLD